MLDKVIIFFYTRMVKTYYKMFKKEIISARNLTEQIENDRHIKELTTKLRIKQPEFFIVHDDNQINIGKGSTINRGGTFGVMRIMIQVWLMV